MTEAAVIAIVYAILIFVLYRIYTRFVSGLVDKDDDLPLRVNFVCIMAAIGTPVIVVNAISLVAKIVTLLMLVLL